MGIYVAFVEEMKSVLCVTLEYNFNLYPKKYKIKKLVKNTFLKIHFCFTHIKATTKRRK